MRQEIQLKYINNVIDICLIEGDDDTFFIDKDGEVMLVIMDKHTHKCTIESVEEIISKNPESSAFIFNYDYISSHIEFGDLSEIMLELIIMRKRDKILNDILK